MGYNSHDEPVRGGRAPPTQPPRIDWTRPGRSFDSPCALALQGTHHHSLDAKNRLTVPAKARPDLAGGVTIVKAPAAPCLQIWPEAEYERVASESLQGVSPLDPRAQRKRRLVYANTTAAELDAAGRIGFSQEYLDHAGLGKEVRLVGVGLWLEVWDPVAWDRYQAELNEHAEDDLSSFGHPA